MSTTTLRRPTASEHDGGGSGERTVLKATLFCRQCGHESPVDGDWVVTDGEREEGDDAESLVLECPDCDAVVTVRPTFEG